LRQGLAFRLIKSEGRAWTPAAMPGRGALSRHARRAGDGGEFHQPLWHSRIQAFERGPTLILAALMVTARLDSAIAHLNNKCAAIRMVRVPGTGMKDPEATILFPGIGTRDV